MKIVDKANHLPIAIKIVTMLIVIAVVALVNYIFYNYQILKLPKDERKMSCITFDDVASSNFKKDDEYLVSDKDSSNIVFDMKYSYVKNLIVEYESNHDFEIILKSEKANEYGIYKKYEKNEKCYSSFNKSAFPFNQKVGKVDLTFSKEDVKLKNIFIDNTVFFNWRTFTFWVIIIELLLSLFLFSDFFVSKLHVLSFVLCMSFGLIMLICSHNTTSTTLDDETHYSYYNSLSVKKDYSTTDLYMENVLMPFGNQDTEVEIQAYQDFLNNSSIQFLKDEDEFNRRSINYNLLEPNMINYLPTSILLKVLSLFNMKYTTKLIIARLIKLVFYSLIIALSVRIIPIFKPLTLLIGIIPQSLFLATNFSYDPVVNMFLILAFSIFIKEYHEKNKKLSLKSALIFSVSALFGILPKAVYAPVILIALLLPKEKFKNVKQRLLFKGTIIGLFVACMLTFILPLLADPSSRNDYRGGNTSAVEQVRLIVRNPVSFITIFWREAVLQTPNRLVAPETIGTLSYYGSMSSDTSYLLIWLAIILAAIGENKKGKISFLRRVILLLIIAVTMCFIWGSMYLGFTPVGENVINGVQFRYFLPFYLPLIYILMGDSIKSNINQKSLVLMVVVMFALAYTISIYNIVILRYFL